MFSNSYRIDHQRYCSRWIKRRKDNYYKLGKILLLNSIRVLPFSDDVFHQNMISRMSINKGNNEVVSIRTNLRKVAESHRYRERYNFVGMMSKLIDPFHRLDLSKTNSNWNRAENISHFIDWLHSNNVDTTNFQISAFDNYGFGLKATKTLAVFF